MRPRTYVLSGLAIAVGLLVACQTPSDAGSEDSAPIVGGKLDGDESESVVLVLAGDTRCTGTTVAPNLVLTARHCVSATKALADCTARDGTPDGGFAGDDVDPAKVQIYTGAMAVVTALIEKKPPAAVGQKIFHKTDPTVCGDDLALILLDKPLTTPVAPLRLDSGPTEGEFLLRVGFGMDENGEMSKYRLARSVLVKATPPTTHIAEAEFLSGESGCEGDDGAPSLAKSGAVVGVFSRHGEGTTGDGGARTCLGIAALNVDTALKPMRDVIDAAFTAANATPTLEAKPVVPDASADGVDAARETPDIPVLGDRHAASGDPKPGADLVPELRPVDAGANAPPKEADSGCSTSGAGGSSEISWMILGLAVAFVGRRRLSDQRSYWPNCSVLKASSRSRAPAGPGRAAAVHTRRP